MLNKKNLLAVAVIINIIIAVFLSVDVWADDAPAGDEQATFSNTLPDALILLDLSGSMANNPAGTAYPYGADTSCVGNTTACANPQDPNFVYSHDSACIPDLVNCVGSPDSTRIYGADANCTANTTAGYCVSTSGTYKYAHDATCKADTSNCTGSGCSGGFCSGTSHSKCVTDCSAYNCSGGFCASKKTNCQQVCWCQNGMCQSSKNNCTNQCATNKCDAINGFCNDTSQSDCQTDCSKLGIAKRALFNILDDDNSGTIDANDATSLGIRIGYMRYYNCSSDESSLNYTSGCNTLIDVISTITNGVSSQNQTSYQLTYCGNSTSCASTVTSCTTGTCIAGEQATGGTPLASALKEAKLYLDTHKAGDAYKACRQKFVILVTDGDDTYACSGNGQECQSKMYARRREVVAATKQLADAGYKVFVIGFGSQMPTYLQNTLNWMAWYGGTDNPLLTNSPKSYLTAYNIPLGCNNIPAVTSACCNLTTNATACYPSGITSCQTDSSTITNSDCGSLTSGFQATYNDPGYLTLSGYAFLAGDATALTASLKSAINTIRDSTYSFSQASIQATRTIDEDYLYEASFEPIYNDPLWIGHLKRYTINQDGTVATTSDWDAGAVLQATAASARNIYTTDPSSASGVLKTFTTANLTNAILGVTTDAARTSIVNFMRGGESVTNYKFYGWKLGDILHAAPLSIPTPNPNFYDANDTSSPKAFTTYMTNHPRTSANGKRLIIVGANDGQLHAIKTGAAGSGGGSELWSFVPPNFLPKLQYIAHSSHPTELTHTYFVDGPLSAADVWMGTGGTIGATAKSYGDWHTYLVASEGRGGISTLWSSSSSCSCLTSATDCSTVFSSSYSSTYNKYCGYYAFDTTDTSTVPTLKWTIGGTSGLSATDGTYLGQPWSKMAMGRVRISNAEKWVGLIGGGCAGTNCASVAPTDTRGKGFYVVDLSNGNILWRYTYNNNNTNMVYNIPAGPAAVDFDSDGFLDMAYVGDTGGNMWRFKFCLAGDDTTASPCACTSSSCSKWSGSLLFSKPSTTLSIFTSASVAFDSSQNLWVFFGTGDKTNPVSTTTQDRIYAITDSDRSTTYQLSDLTDITSSLKYDITAGKHGWYINFPAGTGEKLLAAPVVYDKKVYFTTFTPSVTPCDQNGIAKLYVVDYITGAGEFSNGARSENIGTGVPSGVVVSVNPYTRGYDVFVSTSSPVLDSSGNAHTYKETDPSKVFTRAKNLIYWRDNRVQP